MLWVVLHTVHRNLQKCNFWYALGVFPAFYRGHFSHDFCAQDVSLKSKALATKCIFQNYSQLLDICTRLVFKTTEELFVPSVYENTLNISWEENNKRESKQASRRTSALSRLHYPLTSAITVPPNIMNMRDFVSWIARRYTVICPGYKIHGYFSELASGKYTAQFKNFTTARMHWHMYGFQWHFGVIFPSQTPYEALFCSQCITLLQ